jgi:hypothetical protein
MVRDLVIHINTGDWFIEFKPEITKQRRKEYKPLDSAFASCRVGDDGKLVYVFEHLMGDPRIIWAQKYGKEFLEVCNFTYKNTGEKFTGDFIDALLFIDRILKEADRSGNKSITG